MKYNKLIRDLIPDRMQSKGVKFELHEASQEEYENKLREKLNEEVAEYLKDRTADELADIMEVVMALGELHGLTATQLEEIRMKKAQERGGFKKKLILDSTE